MPELPEVEIQRRMLERISKGSVLERIEIRDPVRFEGREETLIGSRIRSWSRLGKYLLADLGPLSLLSHLGMTGQWVLQADAERPHQRIRLYFSSGTHVGLIDPRRFGWTWILPTSEVRAHPRLASLGIDPMTPDFSAEALECALGSSKRALKHQLMDQKVVAGLGNIALSDLCWRAKVHPHQPSRDLTPRDWRELQKATLEHIHYVLKVEEGDEIAYLGYKGAANPFLCYGREGEPCPRCKDAFVKGALSGRASYWCPTCQPAP